MEIYKWIANQSKSQISPLLLEIIPRIKTFGLALAKFPSLRGIKPTVIVPTRASSWAAAAVSGVSTFHAK